MINLVTNEGLTLKSHGTHHTKLTTKHLNLAAQVPSAWIESDISWKMAQLAQRKLFFRARLQAEFKFYLTTIRDFSKVGRIKDSAYSSYDLYRQTVCAKLNLSLGPILPFDEQHGSDVEAALAFRLYVPLLEIECNH